MKSLFTAIGTQPKDKQVGYLKTLLGQWAIESGAKLTGNLDLFVKTLDDVGDASKYNGSMYKEFMLKCETSESVLTMLGSAWRAVRIEVGNNFLPVLKDVAGFGIEKLNDLRAALPDIAERVRQVIEYLLNNGDKVATTIAGIGTAWAGMRFAPQILQVVSSATKFAAGRQALWGLYRRACLAQEKLAICGRLQNLEHSWQTALFRRAAILASGRECRTPSLVASLECKTAKSCLEQRHLLGWQRQRVRCLAAFSRHRLPAE